MKILVPRFVVTVLFASPFLAQVRQLSGDLASASDRDVFQFWSSADSDHAFFLADIEVAGTNDLYSVPAAGGPALRLSSLLPGGVVLSAYPDSSGARVAFLAVPGTLELPSLYSAPSDGSAPALRLTTTLAVLTGSDSVRVAATGRVVFTTAEHLYSVALDGSAAPILLSGAVNGDFALQTSLTEPSFALSPDGTHVAFFAERDAPRARRVYVAPTDGSAPALELAEHVDLISGVRVPAFTPDGARVFYVYGGSSMAGIYSVPSDGSGSTARVGSTGEDYRFAPGARVVFSDSSAVYCAPLDASAPATVLATFGGGPTHLRLAGTRVVYLDTDLSGPQAVTEVFSVPLDASAAPLRLHPPFAGAGAGEILEVTPDGQRLVYSADAEVLDEFALYVVPVDGSQAPLELSGPLVTGGDVQAFEFGEGVAARITPDGTRVLFAADACVDQMVDLLSVPLDGSSPPLRLNEPLPFGGDLASGFSIENPLLLADGSRVVYRADQGADELFELFSVPPGGGAVVRLNPALATGPVTGDVEQFAFVSGGEALVYRADARDENLYELSLVPFDGSVPAQRFLPALALSAESNFQLSSEFVVYQDASFPQPLYAAPLDFGQKAVRLTPSLNQPVAHFVLAGPGRAAFVADLLTAGVNELFGVALDGSSPPVRLSGPPVANGDVLSGADDFAVRADGAWVAYLADQVTNGVNELFTAPSDASAAPVRLNGPLAAGGDVTDFLWALDGGYVLYRADELVDNQFELFRAPADGSSAPVRLSASLASTRDVDSFVLSPDGTRVLYRADQDVDERLELYSVPVDGSAAPVKLNGTLIALGDVSVGFAFAPDSSRVLFRADAFVDTRQVLFSAPLDGSSPAVLLNGPLATGQVEADFRFADAGRVLYRAQQDTAGVVELYAVDATGGATTRVNSTLVAGGDVLAFALTSDGRTVVYQADQEFDERAELFQRSVRGGLPPQKISAPLVAGGSVRSFALHPNGRGFVYTADQDHLGVVELYAGRSSAPRAEASAAPTGSAVLLK